MVRSRAKRGVSNHGHLLPSFETAAANSRRFASAFFNA
jgi:hypothetical protein